MSSRERDDAMAGLLKRTLAGDAGAGDDCPGPDILAAYFERSLDADETAHVELHLSECARCREQLAALGRAEEAAATPVVQAPRHQPRAPWLWDWRWLAPVAAVLILTAVWATRRPELTRDRQPRRATASSRRGISARAAGAAAASAGAGREHDPVAYCSSACRRAGDAAEVPAAKFAVIEVGARSSAGWPQLQGVGFPLEKGA